nr:MAG TPA: cytochrome c-552 [Caudoviricetes sp.]
MSALATSSDIFTCCFPNEKPFFASYCASCMQNDLLCINLWYNLFEKEVENYEIY